MSDVHVSTEVYIKILSHACRYPNNSVMGVLIGSTVPKIECEVAIPLLHTRLTNTPLLSFGFAMAENMAKSKGMEILGAYFANSDESRKLTATEELICQKITHETKKPCLTLLVNANGLATSENCLFIAQRSSDSEISLAPVQLNSDAIKMLENTITSGRHLLVDDLEVHCFNAAADPLKEVAVGN